MIKSISILRPASSSTTLQSVKTFFDGLGFESGDAWNQGRSSGLSFLAPTGQIEFVAGEQPAAAEIMIEVSGLDALHLVISKRAEAKKQAPAPPSELSETSWGARLFYAQPVPGMTIVFWEWASPEKRKENAAGQGLRQIEGELVSRGQRFGIVVSRWNSFITERLLQGALDALRRSGVSAPSITVVRVPGAFEIPSAARTLAATGKVEAIVCLGCLIRGETEHYEHISTEVTRGIGQSAQETGVPHSFGVLTCENLRQAVDRAGLKSGNKGFEAAMAAVEMAALQPKLRPGKRKGSLAKLTSEPRGTPAKKTKAAARRATPAGARYGAKPTESGR